MFKSYDINNIEKNEAYQVFSYNINATNSLSSYAKAYCVNSNDNTANTYYYILNKFYEEQQKISTSPFKTLVHTANYVKNKGSVSSLTSSFIVISFDKTIMRDGISNVKSEKNINIECKTPVTYNGNIYLADSVTGKTTPTFNFYDKKDSASAGDMYYQINGFNIDNTPIPVGKIYYEYGTIVIDSLNTLSQTIYSSITSNYPSIGTTSNFNFVGNVSGNIYNVANSTTAQNFGYYNSATGVNVNLLNKFFIKSLNVDFIVYTTSYIINVPISETEALVSINKNDSSKRKATENDPIWLSRVGFYDASGNLLCMGKLSNPIKKSNTRSVSLKFRVDM